MAARACCDPGPKLCWAESGLFIHKSEKVGTPFFHRCSVKARVVQSLRVGVFNESFGNGPRAFVSSVIRFSGRVAPAKTFAPCSELVRSARSGNRPMDF